MWNAPDPKLTSLGHDLGYLPDQLGILGAQQQDGFSQHALLSTLPSALSVESHASELYPTGPRPVGTAQGALDASPPALATYEALAPTNSTSPSLGMLRSLQAQQLHKQQQQLLPQLQPKDTIYLDDGSMASSSVLAEQQPQQQQQAQAWDAWGLPGWYSAPGVLVQTVDQTSSQQNRPQGHNTGDQLLLLQQLEQQNLSAQPQQQSKDVLVPVQLQQDQAEQLKTLQRQLQQLQALQQAQQQQAQQTAQQDQLQDEVLHLQVQQLQQQQQLQHQLQQHQQQQQLHIQQQQQQQLHIQQQQQQQQQASQELVLGNVRSGGISSGGLQASVNGLLLQSPSSQQHMQQQLWFNVQQPQSTPALSLHSQADQGLLPSATLAGATQMQQQQSSRAQVERLLASISQNRQLRGQTQSPSQVASQGTTHLQAQQNTAFSNFTLQGGNTLTLQGSGSLNMQGGSNSGPLRMSPLSGNGGQQLQLSGNGSQQLHLSGNHGQQLQLSGNGGQQLQLSGNHGQQLQLSGNGQQLQLSGNGGQQLQLSGNHNHQLQLATNGGVVTAVLPNGTAVVTPATTGGAAALLAGNASLNLTGSGQLSISNNHQLGLVNGSQGATLRMANTNPNLNTQGLMLSGGNSVAGQQLGGTLGNMRAGPNGGPNTPAGQNTGVPRAVRSTMPSLSRMPMSASSGSQMQAAAGLAVAGNVRPAALPRNPLSGPINQRYLHTTVRAQPPSWAGADWNPRAAVSCHASSSGTGVFLPQMQRPPASNSTVSVSQPSTPLNSGGLQGQMAQPMPGTMLTSTPEGIETPMSGPEASTTDASVAAQEAVAAASALS